MGSEHDVIELGGDVVGVETGDRVVERVEPPARLAATVADLGRDAHREHAGLPGFDEIDRLVVPVELLDKPENRRAALRPAGEVDLDGVGSGQDDPATGVDPHTDPAAAQDLGEAAEARGKSWITVRFVSHRSTLHRCASERRERAAANGLRGRGTQCGHALNTTPRSGTRR